MRNLSNWWKRFFGLDDEEPFDEKDHLTDTQNRQNTFSTTKGRFQDPGRHVEVKMVNQYPIGHSKSQQKGEKRRDIQTRTTKKWATSKWDEPAYTRTTQRSVLHKRPAQKRNGFLEERRPQSKINNNVQRNDSRAEYQGNEVKEIQKKKPFRPTTVPSPIYGYKQREDIRRPVKETKEALPEIDKMDVLNLPEVSEIQEFNNNSIELEEVNELSLEDMDIDRDDAYPLESGYQDPKVEEGFSETVMDHQVVEEKSYEEGSPTQDSFETEKRASTLPYNVLMYGADRHALRKKQVPSPTPSQADHSLNDQRSSTAVIQKEAHINNLNINDHQTIQRMETRTKGQALPIDLFQDPPNDIYDDGLWIDEKREILKQVLKNFHVNADIVSYVQGPTVTRFEIRLHPGVKVSKVVALTEDIKLSMAAEQIRIAPVAGKSTVGIEIPNEKRKPVYLKRVLQSDSFKNSSSPLTAALGIDISGCEVVTDLSKMPHGLIAGATGSGKSVCIHSLILSLIYKTDPSSLRLVLIDPKVVELSMYQRLPHLAAPVINQPKDAALALRWAVDEMERRYQAFADIGVRDIKKYNQSVSHEEKWPYIVIIIDELADLMMASPQDVEESICRIAQKARAAGIHLLLATQRPSVDVITGLIKANIPTRIAFGVSSGADSRTILDSGGAERLLGQGDMLFAENGSRDIQRLQGAFVSDEEIDRVTEFFASWPAPPHLFDPTELREQRRTMEEDDDELYEEAANFVIDQGQASVSSLQRRFRIGYNRAARLIDSLEANDVISEANGSKPRQVLVTKEMFMDD